MVCAVRLKDVLRDRNSEASNSREERRIGVILSETIVCLRLI